MEKRFDTFSMLVSGINKSMKKIKTTEMAKFGLKSTHVFCIYHLYKENALTAGELCGMCREDKAGISRAIEQLEKIAQKNIQVSYIINDEDIKEFYDSIK